MTTPERSGFFPGFENQDDLRLRRDGLADDRRKRVRKSRRFRPVAGCRERHDRVTVACANFQDRRLVAPVQAGGLGQLQADAAERIPGPNVIKLLLCV